MSLFNALNVNVGFKLSGPTIRCTVQSGAQCAVLKWTMTLRQRRPGRKNERHANPNTDARAGRFVLHGL